MFVYLHKPITPMSSRPQTTKNELSNNTIWRQKLIDDHLPVEIDDVNRQIKQKLQFIFKSGKSRFRSTTRSPSLLNRSAHHKPDHSLDCIPKFNSLNFTMGPKEILEQYRKPLIDGLIKQDINRINLIVPQILTSIVDSADLKGLKIAVLVLSKMLGLVQMHAKSLVLFYQSKILSERTGDNLMHVESILGVSNALVKLRNPDLSILMLKRALQYCWLIEESPLELSVYQQLALSYFVQGLTEKAQYFHMRVTKGLVESQTSPIRNAGIKWIKKEIAQTRQIGEVNSYLLAHLSLPLSDSEPSTELRQNYDYTKCKMFKEPNIEYLVHKISNEQSTYQQISTPRFYDQKHHNSSTVPKPPYKSPEVQLQLPLDVKIQHRLRYTPVSDDLQQQIKKLMIQHQAMENLQKNKILLTHLTKEQEKFRIQISSSKFRQQLNQMYDVIYSHYQS